MGTQQHELLGKIDALSASIDLYVPTRTIFLEWLITDGPSVEDVGAWSRTSGPDEAFLWQSGGIVRGYIGSNHREVWVELCDTILHFGEGRSDGPETVDAFPEGFQPERDSLYLFRRYRTINASKEQGNAARFEIEFVRGVDDVLAEYISSGLLRIPWPLDRLPAWPRVMLRLGMQGIHPLLKADFLRGDPFVVGIDRRGPGWGAKAKAAGKWFPGSYIAFLSPDIRTATEICLDYIRRMIRQSPARTLVQAGTEVPQETNTAAGGRDVRGLPIREQLAVGKGICKGPGSTDMVQQHSASPQYSPTLAEVFLEHIAALYIHSDDPDLPDSKNMPALSPEEQRQQAEIWDYIHDIGPQLAVEAEKWGIDSSVLQHFLLDNALDGTDGMRLHRQVCAFAERVKARERAELLGSGQDTATTSMVRQGGQQVPRGQAPSAGEPAGAKPKADAKDQAWADDGEPFYKPIYFKQWNIGDELLRRNATDSKEYTEGKVRRQMRTPSSTTRKSPAKGRRGKSKGRSRPVYWYSEPDARRRWPERFAKTRESSPK